MDSCRRRDKAGLKGCRATLKDEARGKTQPSKGNVQKKSAIVAAKPPTAITRPGGQEIGWAEGGGGLTRCTVGIRRRPPNF